MNGDMMEEEQERLSVEYFLGDSTGFRLEWAILPYRAEVKIVDLSGEPDELYLDGYIKWDGCSEFTQLRVHWCGQFFYRRHIALLEHIHNRAFELMGCEPIEPWGKYKLGDDKIDKAG